MLKWFCGFDYDSVKQSRETLEVFGFLPWLHGVTTRAISVKEAG